jgi:hypothetical protein
MIKMKGGEISGNLQRSPQDTAPLGSLGLLAEACRGLEFLPEAGMVSRGPCMGATGWRSSLLPMDTGVGPLALKCR